MICPGVADITAMSDIPRIVRWLSVTGQVVHPGRTGERLARFFVTDVSPRTDISSDKRVRRGAGFSDCDRGADAKAGRPKAEAAMDRRSRKRRMPSRRRVDDAGSRRSHAVEPHP